MSTDLPIRTSFTSRWVWVTALILPAAVFLVLNHENVAAMSVLTKEDGLVEDLQAVGYFGASVGFAAAGARRLHRRDALAAIVWIFLLAALCFIAGGEEISWGQRIFGIATPAELSQANLQHETNFHNLRAVKGYQSLVLVSTLLLLFVILPLANRGPEKVKRLLRFLRLPIAPFITLLTTLTALTMLTVARTSPYPYADGLYEVEELYAALSFVLFAGAEWIRSRRITVPPKA